jgi:hypothetical protein
MRFPIATSKICRRVAKWAVVGIVLFMVVIRIANRWPPLARKRLGYGSFSDRSHLRREERFNKGARVIIHSNCLLPVLSDGGLKFLVTSFECFGVCRFTAAANAVHTARKISSAKTASNLRPADADDSKPGGHSHDRASR